MTADPRHLGPVTTVTPEAAGWTYCGLDLVTLTPGTPLTLHTADAERAVLPLSGGDVVCEVEGRRFHLEGRTNVFARIADWAYLPIDAEVRLSSSQPTEVALPSARATRRFDPAHIKAADVAVEVRGAGSATRQVTNFMSPEAFDGADKLMCVELLTPDGNWSSYPPHRHDDSPECPVNNEEIYYFRIGHDAGRGIEYSADGFAMHRTYVPAADGGSPAGPIDLSVDVSVAVGDGDVFVIPRGYHGPCIAAPGYPLYYLNVLAGPGGERSMAFCDDPAHHWVRDSWADQPLDERCPMTSAAGVVVRGAR